MSLLPEVERELMRAARAPEPVGVEPDRGRPGLASIIRKGLPAAALVLIVLAAVGVGGVFLGGLHSGPGSGSAGHRPLKTSVKSAFPGAPATQHGSWAGGGNLCPLAAPNRYLPPRSGCVSAAMPAPGFLVIVYGHLSDRKVGRLYVANHFTLEILRRDRSTLRARLQPSIGNPAILLIGRATPTQRARIYIETGHISSGWYAVVYSLWHQRLLPADVTLSFGGDSAARSAFECRAGHPPTVVQHSWVLGKGGENGFWRQTDTTFAWRGPRLVRIGGSSSTRHGAPPVDRLARGCVKMSHARSRAAVLQTAPIPR